MQALEHFHHLNSPPRNLNTVKHNQALSDSLLSRACWDTWTVNQNNTSSLCLCSRRGALKSLALLQGEFHWVTLSSGGRRGAGEGNNKITTTKKRYSFPAGHRECEAPRTANCRRITSEFFGFGALSLQLRPATQSESQVFPYHLSVSTFRGGCLWSVTKGRISWWLCLSTKSLKLTGETEWGFFVIIIFFYCYKCNLKRILCFSGSLCLMSTSSILHLELKVICRRLIQYNRGWLTKSTS